MRPELKAWADENIIWAGGPNTKKSSRRGYKPLMIVNHISEGTLASMVSWFNNPKAYGSAHFAVGRKGEIRQFVNIDECAWANGLTSGAAYCSSEAVKNMNYLNPNRYSVSIEHEGIYGETGGELTPVQLAASQMLHMYITEYVQEVYQETIWPNRDRILGHCDIDSKNRPNCPGHLFPYNAIIGFLGGQVEDLPFDDISDHWIKELALVAHKKGIISGDGSGLLKPDRPMTKAEGIAMVMNLYYLIDEKINLD